MNDFSHNTGYQLHSIGTGVLSHSMDIQALFGDHLNTLQQQLDQALAGTNTAADAVLIHSGSYHSHYADDQGKPFRAWGHFLRWIPVDRADQFVLLRPGVRPLFIALIPQDYWHDSKLDIQHWWAAHVDVKVISRLQELPATLIQGLKLTFLGENSSLAESLGVASTLINPPALLNWLDYERAFKTPYELQRLAEANAHALTGHQAAHDAFLSGQDEFDIHMAYLSACRVLENELPYPNIVGINDHAAILHYQHKSRHNAHSDDRPENKVLLIDAGCRANSYCSDITRTWCRPGVHPLFSGLLAGMQKLQSTVIQDIRTGMDFGDLHHHAHFYLAQLLSDSGLCRGNAEELVTAGITQSFLPHGLGHLLGLQVHDVGGRLADREGHMRAPPAHYPALRNTRRIEENMVFTIEPGLYFIPMLLDQLKVTTAGKLVDWSAVSLMMPLGGIRIEDNIWVQKDGVHNLTRRPLLPLLSQPTPLQAGDFSAHWSDKWDTTRA